MPNKATKPMNPKLKEVLESKFKIIKDNAYSVTAFDTVNVEKVLTINSVLRIQELYEK